MVFFFVLNSSTAKVENAQGIMFLCDIFMYGYKNIWNKVCFSVCSQWEVPNICLVPSPSSLSIFAVPILFMLLLFPNCISTNWWSDEWLHWYATLMWHIEHTLCSVDKKNQLDVTFCILYFSSDRDRWRTLVSAVMNLRVPWNAGNFLTSCKPVSCSRRTLHHGLSK